MDFEDRLADYIDTLDVGLKLVYDYTNSDESMSIARLPGGQITQEYFDGTVDKELLFEIEAKVKPENRILAMNALYRLTESLNDLVTLPSLDGSFDFIRIRVTNEIFFSEATTGGFNFYRINIKPELTIHKKEIE